MTARKPPPRYIAKLKALASPQRGPYVTQDITMADNTSTMCIEGLRVHIMKRHTSSYFDVPQRYRNSPYSNRHILRPTAYL